MSASVTKLNSELETQDFARQCANEAHQGDIFLLSGPLGAGKSVFARAFIQYLMGENIDVPSPTFTLLQTYDAAPCPIWHFDLYRIKTSDEIYELGWEDGLNDTIMLIEWPERLGYLKPAHYIEIKIEALKNNVRQISMKRV